MNNNLLVLYYNKQQSTILINKTTTVSSIMGNFFVSLGKGFINPIVNQVEIECLHYRSLFIDEVLAQYEY